MQCEVLQLRHADGSASVGIVDESGIAMHVGTLARQLVVRRAGNVGRDASIGQHSAGEEAPTSVCRGQGRSVDTKHDESSHDGAPFCRLGDGSR